MADPRDRRGMHHDLPTVLSPAVTRVLAGYRSPTTIWEHPTDLTGADLRSVGLGRISPFHLKSTIWRLLQESAPSRPCQAPGFVVAGLSGAGGCWL